MVRTWLTSGLVALICVACDVPLDWQGGPPPEASVGEDADVPDAYEPVTHYEAGAGTAADGGGSLAHEAGAPDAHADAPAVEGGAPDAGMQTDAADEPEGDGGDEGRGHGGDRPVEAH